MGVHLFTTLLLSSLLDRAPKEQYRGHSLFEGVFDPKESRLATKEMGQTSSKFIA